MPQSQADELREVIREANGVRKDLERVLKEARQFISNEVRSEIKRNANAAIEGMHQGVQEAMDEAVQRVFREFNKLEKLLLGDGKGGRPTIHEIAEAEDIARRLQEHG